MTDTVRRDALREAPCPMCGRDCDHGRLTPDQLQPWDRTKGRPFDYRAAHATTQRALDAHHAQSTEGGICPVCRAALAAPAAEPREDGLRFTGDGHVEGCDGNPERCRCAWYDRHHARYGWPALAAAQPGPSEPGHNHDERGLPTYPVFREACPKGCDRDDEPESVEVEPGRWVKRPRHVVVDVFAEIEAAAQPGPSEPGLRHADPSRDGNHAPLPVCGHCGLALAAADSAPGEGLDVAADDIRPCTTTHAPGTTHYHLTRRVAARYAALSEKHQEDGEA